MKYWFTILFLGAMLLAGAQKAADATPLHRAQSAITNVMVHDIFAPPVAARIYLYASIAAYEAARPANTSWLSMAGSVKGFPQLPQPAAPNIRYDLASVYALVRTARRFVFSEQMLDDSLQLLLRSFGRIDSSAYHASVAWGRLVSDSIVAWSDGDHYRDTRKLRRYNLKKEEGKWLPTAPGYMAAVEPHWSRMRTVAMDSAAECRPLPPPAFSVVKDSVFYRQALEVYDAGRNLSVAQRDIALFWDCNPFYLNVQGHLNFATKKLSPGGHWMSIAGIAARKSGADLNRSAAAYLLTAIALYDGFISCWDEKYRSNLVRPETFINAHIDEAWRPLLQTPPFPEYTSGHSVVSTAAALVLTRFFGDHFSFDDHTETPYGLPVRSFRSFNEAAAEAAISRLYGGIHYRAAVEQGQVQGQRVGAKVWGTIKLDAAANYAAH